MLMLQFVQGLYIVAGVLFILSLAGLAKQTTARMGNLAGMIGMVLALVATIIHSVNMSATQPERLSPLVTLLLILAVLALGAVIGTPIARKVEMTQMPELIAAFHSFVGMAAVLVGFNSFAVPEGATGAVHSVEVALGVLIGAYTFTGSVVAYLKLSAKMKSAPLTLPGRNLINLVGFVLFFALMIWFVIAGEHNPVLGWILIIAIAVVGFASKSGYGDNTELLSIAGSNSGSVGVAYHSITDQNLKDVLQKVDTSAGQTMVSTAIDALAASGATRTDLGLDMAQRILSANPVQPNEKRNRVVIVFTDGAPTSFNGFEKDVADNAITYAGTIKTAGATVYTIGIFAGADATSAGTEPSGDLGQNSKSMNSACNWFMQQVSSNNGTPCTPSYYLSAADAGSLSNIFQQISDNIETGGSSSTLTEGSVVRDIISPQFTLPAGSTASDITLETYACTGKDGGTYTWRQNDTAMGATAAIDGNSVSVTGFDFSENYVGTVTDHGSVSYRGHKLVIRFSVKPQPGFLGGNNVPTNAGAGVYENKDSEIPVREFPQPTVNVPIQPVTVAAQDYNVYLLGGLTASQLQNCSTVQVGSISLDLAKATDPDHPYGLEPWQTAYVDITVSLTGPDGSPVTDLAQLRADTSYAVSVTVSPKTEPQADSSGTPAAKQSGSATGKVNVFKPTLTYEDGTVYYGDTFDRATLPGYRTSTSWFHNGTDAATVSMTGAEPKLNSAYSYDTTRLTDTVNTKQDIPVKATISIGDTNITADTAFLHTSCAGETWSHTSGDPAFLLHVRTCALTVTKTGGADGEPYVFNVCRNGDLYTQVTVVGSSSVSLYELPVGKYTIAEDTGWSWRCDAAYNPDKPDGCTLTAGHNSGSITCTNTLKNDRWLNGFSDVIANIFGIRH